MLNRTGRIEDLTSWKYGGEKTRTPMMYCHPVKTSAWLPWNYDYLVQGSKFLENTNETFHPSLRYRRCCGNQKKLGAQDRGKYDTKNMNSWTWPAGQLDGRIGLEGSSVSAGNFAYSTSRVEEGVKETVTVQESRMGYYEQLLLAIYDQDLKLRGQNSDSIWREVIGGDG